MIRRRRRVATARIGVRDGDRAACRAARVYQELLERGGLDLDSRHLRHAVQLGDARVQIGEGLWAPPRRRGDRDPDRGEVAALRAALVSSGNVLYPGADGCVRRLAAAWPIGIASGALRGEIELMLRGAGLLSIASSSSSPSDRARSRRRSAGTPPRRRTAGTARCRVRRDRENSHWLQQLLVDAQVQRPEPGCAPRSRSPTPIRAPTLTEADVIVDSLDELTVDFVKKLKAESW